MASYGKRSRNGGSTSGSSGKNPGWSGIQKNKSTPVRAGFNAAEWPVYMIGNVTFQWNHKPRSTTDEERTIATLAAYMANPNDQPGVPANFKNYQPVWGIVKRGPHTTDSTTSAIPDEDWHTTVKFSNQDDRDNYQGYTVHIYNDIHWQYDPSKYCTWAERTPDEHQDQRVYYNRRDTPPTKYYTLPINASDQQSAIPTACPSNYTGVQSSSDYSSASMSCLQGTASSQSSSVYSSAPVSYFQGTESSQFSSVYSSTPVPNIQGAQPLQSSSVYTSTSVPNIQGNQPLQSTSFTPTYHQEGLTGYYYCLLRDGTKIYWSGGKYWYIDSNTNNWVEHTGALNE